MDNYIQLGKYKIRVSVSNNLRMVNNFDIQALLGTKSKSDYFIDAKIITATLFDKIYISKNATKEQEIIYKGLCIVGLYPLIDEACAVDLRRVSYIKEFNHITNPFSYS